MGSSPMARDQRHSSGFLKAEYTNETTQRGSGVAGFNGLTENGARSRMWEQSRVCVS
jgi:hypothetical protein